MSRQIFESKNTKFHEYPFRREPSSKRTKRRYKAVVFPIVANAPKHYNDLIKLKISDAPI